MEECEGFGYFNEYQAKKSVIVEETYKKWKDIWEIYEYNIDRINNARKEIKKLNLTSQELQAAIA